MKIPKTKLKAMLRYFCTNTNPSFLGKTKLMKLFYFADFLHVKKYGVPITYDTYIRLEHGPVPSKILNLINSIIDDNEQALLSDTIFVKKADGMNIQQILSFKPFDKNDEKYFTKRELGILEEVCKKYGDKNTKFIETESHKEAAWQNTDEMEEIPYTLAAYDPDSMVEEDDIKLLMNLV